VETCLAFDEINADATLTHAFALYPAEVVCVEVLQKGIVEIGQGWYEGEISVQQEHFATGLAIRKLNTLISATPPPYRQEKIIVACPPEEDHTFSPLFITLILRQRGWPVIYLGANVPLAELKETIKNVSPSLMIMSAQILQTAATLAEIARKLHQQVPIAYGGRIFNIQPKIRQQIPGHFMGEELIGVAASIEQIVTKSPPLLPASSPSKKYQDAFHHFRDQQAAIEARLWEKLGSNGVERQYLTHANYHLTQDIEAALALGDMNFLGNEISWLEGLLINYDVPKVGLMHFLHAYQEAAISELDERGTPVVEWLSSVLK
jgi:hypothetical protein